ncbi:FCP1-like domain, HAD-like domain protein [Artemisia annua]|uniref:FCP1-like domain, HAD-like domain protein n=1 Tax=Artemisia annua TaxID=35608 RepID=A0A2U1L6Q6_ARTAN|nr:FCP1-like domain, HAD-like domain protein [Artemisia annua]
MLLKAHLFLAYREFMEHVKDLSCISTNFCRIVIADNNPFSFLLQPVNGIPCIPFSAGQPHDDQVTRTSNMQTRDFICFLNSCIWKYHIVS